MSVFVSPLTAFLALAGTVVIQQFVYTFISPKIMSDSVDVHPALTLFALMCGSALGGAMNGLLGVARGHARLHPSGRGGEGVLRVLLREANGVTVSSSRKTVFSSRGRPLRATRSTPWRTRPPLIPAPPLRSYRSRSTRAGRAYGSFRALWFADAAPGTRPPVTPMENVTSTRKIL